MREISICDESTKCFANKGFLSLDVTWACVCEWVWDGWNDTLCLRDRWDELQLPAYISNYRNSRLRLAILSPQWLRLPGRQDKQNQKSCGRVWCYYCETRREMMAIWKETDAAMEKKLRIRLQNGGNSKLVSYVMLISWINMQTLHKTFDAFIRKWK